MCFIKMCEPFWMTQFRGVDRKKVPILLIPNSESKLIFYLLNFNYRNSLFINDLKYKLISFRFCYRKDFI